MSSLIFEEFCLVVSTFVNDSIVTASIGRKAKLGQSRRRRRGLIGLTGVVTITIEDSVIT